MTPFLDKNLLSVSCAPSSCFLNAELMLGIQAIPAILRSSVWGEHATFFDHCGQGLVFLVDVFLNSETRHALFTGVLSDFAGCRHGEHKAKAYQVRNQANWKPFGKIRS